MKKVSVISNVLSIAAIICINFSAYLAIDIDLCTKKTDGK